MTRSTPCASFTAVQLAKCVQQLLVSHVGMFRVWSRTPTLGKLTTIRDVSPVKFYQASPLAYFFFGKGSNFSLPSFKY